MNARDVVLAIDMGSTWCKAAYVDQDGAMLVEGRGYSRGGPPFGHSAADLDQSWSVLVRAVRDANDAFVELGHQCQPAAISLSCRKAPGIWLDDNHQPISPPRSAVENSGRRDIEECYAADVWDDLDPFAYGYGVDVIGNTRWLHRMFPELWGRVRRVGTLHNWLVYRMTGRWVSSPAAGPGRFAWPEAASTLSGLPLDTFPEVVESYRAVGSLTSRSADELGLPGETLIVTGTHDGAAANLGAGAMHVGDACLTLGTNGVIRVVTGDPLNRQFGYPIVEGRWAMVRDIVGIAPHLDRIVAAIDSEGLPVSPERHTYLTAIAENVPPGAGGLRLLVPEDNDFSDEHGDEHKRIAKNHAPGAVYRAALEGIALSFRGLVDVTVRAGASPEKFVVTGGATANQLLLRMMSGVIGAPMHTTTHEAGVRGAAILASVGADWFSSLDSAVERLVPEGEAVIATDEERAVYGELAQSVNLPSGVAPGDAVRVP
jgi:sugar (pentulose or hexulose) kinase